MKLLVLGARSMIGSALLEAARGSGWEVQGTSRRAADTHYLPLDLSDPTAELPLSQDYDVAVLCAGITRHDACVADPQRAHVVNVEVPVRIALTLMGRGTHVIFLSSDSVFGEANGMRAEVDPVTPGNHLYPTYKARVERLLSDEAPVDRLSIVRLTKVVSAQREPFSIWCESLVRGLPVEALCDLRLAPISLAYTTSALLKLCEQRRPGVFHLSGTRDISYVDVARGLARVLGHPEAVEGCTLAQAGISPSYRPKHSALDMRATSATTGLTAQSLDSVVRDLIAEYRDAQQPRRVARNTSCAIAH